MLIFLLFADQIRWGESLWGGGHPLPSPVEESQPPHSAYQSCVLLLIMESLPCTDSFMVIHYQLSMIAELLLMVLDTI